MMIYYRLTITLMLFFSVSLTADEGFWQPQQQAELTKLLSDNQPLAGSLSLSQLTKLSQQAVVSIENCSAAFVSRTGLLLTSYQCLADKVRQAGISLNNKLFVAATAQQEQPLPDVDLYINRQVQDVTVAINRQLDGVDDALQRFSRLQLISKQLIQQCEQPSTMRCQLHSVNGGLQHYLIKSERITDVRLVFAVTDGAEAVRDANKGIWPRYNTDFVLLRAYVSAQPATSPNSQIAYLPDAFLPLSTKGISENEQIVVAGFPQHSSRYLTSAELEYLFNNLYPQQRLFRQQALDLLGRLAPRESTQYPLYRNTMVQLQSDIQQDDAILSRYRISRLQQDKTTAEQQLLSWINGSPVRQQLYGPVLNSLQALQRRQQSMLHRDLTLSNLQFAELPSLARRLYRFALMQSDNNDGAVISVQQERLALQRYLDEFERHFDARVDLELALHYLKQYADLPADERVADLDHYFALNDGFNQEIVRHKLAAMYRGTLLTDATARQSWMTEPAEDFVHSQDSLISFAVAMQHASEQLQLQRQKIEAELATLWPSYLEIWSAYSDARQQSFYADANGTLRLSIGTVKGYQPVDAVWYQPFSTVKGLMSHLKQADKKAPALLFDALQQITETSAGLPVNFLSSADITQGHVGAPTLNMQGELVGMVFDGACETAISQWYYDAALSRAIHLDSRFMLFQLRHTTDANRILSELAIAD